MSGTLAFLDDLWFRPAPASRLAVLRIVTGLYALWFTSTRAVGSLVEYAQGDPLLYRTVGVASPPTDTKGPLSASPPLDGASTARQALVRFAADQVQDALILVRFQAVISDEFIGNRNVVLQHAGY